MNERPIQEVGLYRSSDNILTELSACGIINISAGNHAADQ